MKALKIFITRYFHNFAYFYRRLRHRVFISMFMSLAVGVLDGFGLSMFLPLLQMVDGENSVQQEGLGKLGFIVEYMEAAGLGLNLFTVLVILCIFFALKGIAKFCQEAYLVKVQQYFIRELRLNMVQSLNQVDYKSFAASDPGRIQNTMSGEVERVSKAFGSYFKAFEQIILALVYMAFAFFVDLQFAILVTVGGLLTNFIYQVIYKKTEASSTTLTKDSHIFQSLIIQHVANFKYLKATGLLSGFAGKLKKSILDIDRSNRQIGIYGAILTATREPLLIFVVAGVIAIQTQLLGSPLGPILISLLFFYRALTAVVGMQTAWNYFLGNSGSLNNMSAFQEELEQSKEQQGALETLSFHHSIELNNAGLRFGEKWVLKNVNLEIKKNETIAFVGESGSGKTTLVNIVSGLLPLDEGEVKIDGENYRNLNIHTLQRQIGFITQDPVIFNDSIFNNVTFWDKPTAENRARFAKAVEKAAIAEFIESLKKKENTELGNNGINLSGGQKQRISIARELYKEISILILDEATSALDSETEKAIQDNIDRLKGEYTILIVAHRLSTIRNADRIVYMQQGKILETGDFNRLIHHLPHFKRMVELQEI